MSFKKALKILFFNIKVILLVFLCLIPTTKAEELTIALGNFKPLFSEKNEPALFKDLIDALYVYLPQYHVNYHYMWSNSRLVMALNQKTVDGAANIFSAAEIQGCLTQPFFAYADVAVTLKSAHHHIDSLADLDRLSLVSYQGAKTLLGADYRKIVLKNKYYQEIAEPATQAKLLSEGMVDVSIGDKYIFLQSLQTKSKESVDLDKYQFHNIFPLVYSAMGFNKQRHCDDFDQALAKFKASGEYDKVYIKHLQKLGYKKN